MSCWTFVMNGHFWENFWNIVICIYQHELSKTSMDRISFYYRNPRYFQLRLQSTKLTCIIWSSATQVWGKGKNPILSQGPYVKWAS